MRGQVLVILALIIAGLLGVAALGVDVLNIYWNKDRLQAATDAAALAGATYLGDVSFGQGNPQCDYSNDAQNAACTYAIENGVALSEITSIVPDLQNLTITVSTQRQVRALFARVFGIENFTVDASATAGLEGIGSANGVIPIGLDSKTPYVYGQQIVMHEGGCGAGCWQGLALTSQSGVSSGASAFQSNLANGCACTLAVGSIVTSEPGATSGPTNFGVNQRLNAGMSVDPSGTWSDHTLTDPRAATAVLVNWDGCTGSCQVPVTGFAEVWIEGVSGTTITAVFIQQLASGTPSSSASDTGALHATLLQ